MTTDDLFLSKILKLKKRLIFQIARRVILIAIIIFLFSYTTALALEMIGIGQYRHTIGFYVISIGMAIAASLGTIYVKRKRFPQILIDASLRNAK